MKFLKWLFIILVSLTIVGYIAYLVIDKPLPEGQKGEKAEALADKILDAVNDSAWQATDVVSWDFKGEHQHVWDKNRHYAQVVWDDYEVFINLNNITGKAIVKGKLLRDSAATVEFVKDAYEYWANDSFWLNPITKIRDSGTERYYVETENEETEALLVKYTSGGVTPGDSYLWVVDKTTWLPRSVKMWVQIIPVGGVEFSWENWIKTETGALVASEHQGLIKVNINNIHTYKTINEFEKGDIFKILE
ncbi:hypothetical protein JKA74_03185 [Marivirga sp. S37H4]|uniref:Uncharacterized protein n=1 Tax=Marivirga aurantiaca TaxID=2802615 RepID=A0A934WVX1_9BACT|nr:hypothetical protein [Marivirga aurantiaca]MBK6264029.1 hypothetical protein [Marivirga aurantiaca]